MKKGVQGISATNPAIINAVWAASKPRLVLGEIHRDFACALFSNSKTSWTMGTAVSMAICARDCVTELPMCSACVVLPRRITPRQSTASGRRRLRRASLAAITGISKAPGTRINSTFITPLPAKVSSAASIILSTYSALYAEATMAMRASFWGVVVRVVFCSIVRFCGPFSYVWC